MKANLLLALVTAAITAFTASTASAQQTADNTDPFSYSSATEIAPEIRSFSAVSKNNKVYLNWTATDATGDCIYLLERSSDGSNFQKISIKKGAPSPGKEALLYSFTDEQPSKGNIVYRVQQVNANGSSQTATAKVSNATGNEEETATNNKNEENLAFSK